MKLAVRSLYQFGWRLVAEVRGTELPLLVTLFVCVAGAWLFLELADEISDASATWYEQQIILLLREPGRPDDPFGPAWFEESVRDITALGSAAVLALLVAAVICGLLLARHWYQAAAIFLTAAGGELLVFFLKHFYARERPPVHFHATETATMSFPSGHSFLAAVIFIALGTMLARFQRSYKLKVYIISVAVLLALLVGGSRVYLGVHYPSDVLAGWLAGVCWALICWLAGAWVNTRWRRKHPIPEPV